MDALLPQVDGLLGTGMSDPFSGQLCSGGALQASSTINCPKSMVGRVIGKGGETIKALQQFTGAMIQIDQSQDPTRVTVAGDAHSVKMASSMCRWANHFGCLFVTIEEAGAGSLWASLYLVHSHFACEQCCTRPVRGNPGRKLRLVPAFIELAGTSSRGTSKASPCCAR